MRYLNAAWCQTPRPHLESLTEQALKASVSDEACGEIEEGLVHVVGFLVAEF